jgi:hypothetical protein
MHNLDQGLPRSRTRRQAVRNTDRQNLGRECPSKRVTFDGGQFSMNEFCFAPRSIKEERIGGWWG